MRPSLRQTKRSDDRPSAHGFNRGFPPAGYIVEGSTATITYYTIPINGKWFNFKKEHQLKRMKPILMFAETFGGHND